MNFADKLQQATASKASLIVAGYDPQIETFPKVILQEASAKGASNEEAIYTALTSFYALASEALASGIVAVKPNLAFFEQYGVAGIRALDTVCRDAQARGLLVILDGKRGDISTSAQAYSNAYLGVTKVFGKTFSAFAADALTVNPYLGFDTLDVFVKDCAQHDKGIFVLVKTSNPGSGDLQGLTAKEGGGSVSDRVAHWIAENASQLKGSSGLSSLGAVVGATYPDQARALRAIMKDSFFLVPGFGAQGASASDAVAGARPDGSGVIVNMSRGLLSRFSSPDLSRLQLKQELQQTLRESLGSFTHGDAPKN